MLVIQQKEHEKRMNKNKEDAAKWDVNQIEEHYNMESNMFDYDEIKK